MSAKRQSISSNLKRVDKLKDKDIDYSDIPELDDSFFTKTPVILPKKKGSITLRLDHEVLQFFKQHGRGYQTLINAVLKTYASNHQKTKSAPKVKKKRE